MTGLHRRYNSSYSRQQYSLCYNSIRQSQAKVPDTTGELRVNYFSKVGKLEKLKALFMYVLALVVLLAPAILLGWIGWSLLDWWGGVLGIIGGLVVFAFSINKIAQQDAGDEEEQSETSNENSAVDS